MTKVKKLNVLGLIKLHTIAFSIVGLIAGILYGGGGFVYDALYGSINHGTALALLAIPVMPILFGGVGFVIGAVEGILITLLAKLFRGIEL